MTVDDAAYETCDECGVPVLEIENVPTFQYRLKYGTIGFCPRSRTLVNAEHENSMRRVFFFLREISAPVMGYVR